MESDQEENNEGISDLQDFIQTIVHELVNQINIENKTHKTESSDDDDSDYLDAEENVSPTDSLTDQSDELIDLNKEGISIQPLKSEEETKCLSDKDKNNDKRKSLVITHDLESEEQKKVYHCDGCLGRTNVNLESCQNCCSFLCKKCAREHDCRQHQNVINPSIYDCEPCKVMGIVRKAAVTCVDCDEVLCESCHAIHLSQKATRFHNFRDIPFEINCDCCLDRFGKKIHAVGRCQECDECYCDDCLNVHLAQKATRSHTVYALQVKRINAISFCEPCKVNERSERAVHNCLNCNELLCKGCSEIHRSSKLTMSHKLSALSEHNKLRKDSGHQEDNFATNVKFQHENTKKMERAQESIDTNRENKKDKLQPGKPKATNINIDSITLVWDEPEQVLEEYHFQIRYKSVKDGDESDKWKFYEEQPNVPSVDLTGLKSDTEYIFQIRMIKDDHEECYSERSDIIHTKKSAASIVTVLAKKIDLPGVTMQVKKVPMFQEDAARSEEAKTRKLVIGTQSTQYRQEKTILLVGATGSGKSTLIEGMINYVLGVTWDDQYRLSMIDLEKEEITIQTNQAQSQTQWITNYSVNVIPGSRLDYTLNIIDTPGFGDTRGIERDKEILDQIRILFSATDSTGIAHLDAVCLLIKAPDARLTASQKYVFDSILSIFGKDIERNICIFVTFADGKIPPVISALKEAKLPSELYFTFNNSGLFADNTGTNMTPMSPMFWEMGVNSFGEFFNHLENLDTQSLRQTKEVLRERKEVELTVENLLPVVESGLHKLEELRSEIRLLVQHELDIKENKDFTYTVNETHQVKRNLPAGRCVTNCFLCNVTCHKRCHTREDEKKYKCWAMDKKTKMCTQCPNKCHWSQHANTPYIFEYEQVSVEKTYAEKMEKYKQAESEKLTHSELIHRMIEELHSFDDKILQKIKKLNKCNNRLKEIALRPNPLDTDGYIDILIESEKAEMKPGFTERIQALNNLKKRANVNKDVSRFYDTLSDTNNSILAEKIVDKSKMRKKRKWRVSWK